MAVDRTFYDRLKISPDATDEQIKTAYRKQALRWHPDKNGGDPEAAEKFKNLQEAYSVLSDPEVRKQYDTYGKGFADAKPEQSHPANGRYPFGGPFPSSGAGGQPFSSFDANNFASFFNGSADQPFSRFSAGNFQFESKPKPRPEEVTVVTKTLSLSLEDLFNGTTKKMAVNRKTYDPSTGRKNQETRILEVPIKPGLKAGSKIKFSNVGDQTEGGTQDLHFLIAEKPHPQFQRVGDDLITTLDIDVKEALVGWSRTIQTIDKRLTSVKRNLPTPPNYQEAFPNLGMPRSKKPSERGTMIVKVNIKFPTSLTAHQKDVIKDIL